MKCRWLASAVPLLLAAALSACTGGGDGPDVTTAGSDPPGGAASELPFINCMREQGIEMVDPIPGDDSGRSALKYEIDVNGKGSDPAFQAALESCQELLPPPEVPEPDPDEAAQHLAFAQCMRNNGVTDYPDPDPDGQFPPYWIREGDEVAEAAVEACAHLLPSPAPRDG